MNFHLIRPCIFLIFFNISLAEINAQTSCTIPGFILSNYQADVKSISVDYMNQIGLQDSIFIPSWIENHVWDALTSIYNLPSPERDSVFAIYCIHDRPDIVLHQLTIKFDTNQAWVQNLLAGNQSGNAFVDSLLSFFNYNIFASASGAFHVIDLNDTVNVSALVSMLDTVSGVVYCTTNPYFGEDNEIQINGNQLTFKLGWGDCLNGCFFNRSWTFLFNSSICDAQFSAVSGFSIQDTIVGWDWPIPQNCDSLISNCNVQLDPGDVLCTGGTFILGGNPTASNGVAPYIYNWSPSGCLTSATISNPIGFCTEIMYYLTVTDGNGCVKIDSIFVPAPIPPSIQVQTGCDSTANQPFISTQIIGNRHPYSISWWPDTVLSHSDSVWSLYTGSQSSPVLVATIVDSAGCAFLDSVVWIGAGSECSTVNIDAYHSERFNIFPNPSSGFINITAGHELGLVEIFDLQGQLKFKRQLKNNYARLNHQLASGLYFIKIEQFGELPVLRRIEIVN
ncbi:MAG: T9SS type A sorting domain-containing protein [Flavobacteriales bacterium]|nr:T9SS type A sorting domain-containing protein [Flavobacteriales bacterium]